jgi:RimJ/RimL family protein N-acetyltransferase
MAAMLRFPDSLSDGVVLLRQLRSDDRDAMLATMRDPLVRRWLNMPSDPHPRDFEQLRRRVRDGWKSGERYDYVVAPVADDVAVGAVIASRRHRDNYELAYLAGPRGRGNGLMSRAVRLFCDALFEHGVGRLEVRTHPDNAPSQRLAERAGFQREGIERQSIWLHGRREDAVLWSLLPSDRR